MCLFAYKKGERQIFLLEKVVFTAEKFEEIFCEEKTKLGVKEKFTHDPNLLLFGTFPVLFSVFCPIFYVYFILFFMCMCIHTYIHTFSWHKLYINSEYYKLRYTDTIQGEPGAWATLRILF